MGRAGWRQGYGYTILTADSLDAATNVAKTCPHLQAYGQISVYEIYEVK